MLLINCEINLILTCSSNCVLPDAVANQATAFAINDYFPVVTLPIQDNAKLLQQLKYGLNEQLTGININQNNNTATKLMFRLLNSSTFSSSK